LPICFINLYKAKQHTLYCMLFYLSLQPQWLLKKELFLPF
jgi:hypothetical protein